MPTIQEVNARERERQRRVRAARSTPERQAINLAARERAARRRQTERPEDRLARLARDRQRRALARAQEDQQARADRHAQDVARRSNRLGLTIENIGFSYDPNLDASQLHCINIGQIDVICNFCQAKRFPGESDGICCSKGKIKFPVVEQPPEPILSLFTGDLPESRDFLRCIRRYNSCFQMTSFGSTGGHFEPGYMPTFRVQGQIYHRIGSLLPMPDNSPKFLQVYFMGDSNLQIDHRVHLSENQCKRHIIELFQQFLDQNNELVRQFRTNLDQLPSDDRQIVIRADKRPEGSHERVFNGPAVDEIAVVMVDAELSRRDIVLQRRNFGLKRIDESHPFYDAFQYPLIFWRGQGSWHFNLKRVDPITGISTARRASPMDFYAFQLMIREDSQNFLLKCGPLLNQFVVDMYAKIESQRLLFFKQNQSKLRAEQYIHLRDAVINDRSADEIGQPVILPSTFVGGPRHMHEYAQDAMAYVRKYGRPDLFITFTCNPKWPEITRELKQHQPASDRHDITARVFRQKVIKLLNCITKHKMFGPSKCFMYSIEWQKRGLPHTHILLWLENRIRPEQIDQVISAELPDPEADPTLFATIKSSMMHGPCGTVNPNCVCMVDNKCSKRFPRPFVNETQTGEDGYPIYRRRSPADGGQTFSTNIQGVGEYIMDNRWVVPHNRTLCKIFNAHINVEYCHSVKSIKYICKYINKGSDMAVFEIDGQQRVDEVEQYQLGRYISTDEAFWRIYGFPIHDRYPAVQHLSVHLENGQRVYFNADNAQHVADNPPATTLTAFFKLCQTDEFARTLLYSNVSTYYTWNNRSWSRRKQGTSVLGYPGLKASDTISRLYTVHPSQTECFYLRILLTEVRGPKSFEDLRTFEGTLFGTYREACQARGLLEDDKQWEDALDEAAASRSPNSIRVLFAIIISNCFPSDPSQLWERFKEHLSEDLLHDLQRRNQDLDIGFSPDIFNQALIIIEDLTMAMCAKTLSQLGLPTPLRSGQDCINAEILRETSYNRQSMQRTVGEALPNLVPDQRAAFDSIVSAIESQQGGLYFIDAPGGTGKTFLLNLILARLRLDSKIVLAVASSGIAATLLDGGRTAHSMFKLPLDISRSEAPVCNVSRGTSKALLLQQCSAIIWDECTMSHKKSLEALDRTLRDLRRSQSIFGGVAVILAGDFRQTLPVIPRSTPADELNACFKQSSLWHHVTKFRLSTNMRVHLRGDIEAGSFATRLLSIGDGTYPQSLADRINLTSELCQQATSSDELIERVFPDLCRNIANPDWLWERAILAPTNDVVDSLNAKIQNRLVNHQSRTYQSVDQTVDIEQSVNYPIEFLNSLEPSGVPPHQLELKVGAPVIVLRNLSPPKLCNGTRLCIKKLHRNLIEATILAGAFKGEDVFIPRIPFIPNDSIVQFKRVQFPLKVAFGITVNKSQGQSLKVVGVDLTTNCFSHGQLYVACSRTGSNSNLHILAPGGQTRNVVYRQALEN